MLYVYKLKTFTLTQKSGRRKGYPFSTFPFNGVWLLAKAIIYIMEMLVEKKNMTVFLFTDDLNTQIKHSIYSTKKKPLQANKYIYTIAV